MDLPRINGQKVKQSGPFVFRMPDFALHSSLALPKVTVAQIAAFAPEVQIYDSDESFHASQTEGLRLLSQSFIPAGLFNTLTGTEGGRGPQAIITGRVREYRECTSELSGEKFQWALIDTLGGSYDVVAPVSKATEGIRKGCIVHGTFWLSGVIK